MCQFTPVLDQSGAQVNSYAYDPITSYQIVPSPHAHSFYGSTTPTINQNTTELNLRQAGTWTSCAVLDDKSAYWQPVLYKYQAGQFVEQVPLSVNVYVTFVGDQPQPTCSSNQSGIGGTSTQCVNPFPAGATIVAGDGKCGTPSDPGNCAGGGTRQPVQKVYWTCTDSQEGKQTIPPDCSMGNPVPGLNHSDSNLAMHVNFPSCWDGSTTFAPGTQDMSAHFAYPTNQTCPVAYPYREPKFDMQITWPVKDGTCQHAEPPPPDPVANCITLSSGTGSQDANSVLSGHADFFDAWPVLDNPTNALSVLVHTCINADQLCGTPRSPTNITLPASAHVGDVITINGFSFCASRPDAQNPQNLNGNVDCTYGTATAVLFSGAAATSFTTINDTTISVTVPVGATTGPVSVKSPGHAEVPTLSFTGTSQGSIQILP